MKKKFRFKNFFKLPKFTKKFGINFDMLNPFGFVKNLPSPSEIAAMPKWRRHQFIQRCCVIAGAALILLFFTVIGVKAFTSGGFIPATTSNAQKEEGSLFSDEAKQRQAAEVQLNAEIDEVINSYNNIAVAKVDGYLNLREKPEKFADVVGKLYNGGVCDILSADNEEWYLVKSGSVEGYVNKTFLAVGDEAKALARNEVRERAVIKADKLNIRSQPSTDAEIVSNAYRDERYDILSNENGWIQVNEGYMSAEYADVKKSLNEARRLDLRSMVLDLYDNLGISDVQGYLNVREEPSESGKIIGKMTSKAGGEILETLDGWYKIRSGKITGYVKSDYIRTGQAARDEAIAEAQLMAVVNTDILNVRSESNTAAKIWTQISNSEKYLVVSQQDGWVEIELENDNNAFVSTDFVDVRYALNEAIKFSPIEEAAMASQSKRTQIVNYALQFLGNRYVWGGTSLTKGCDCSGFTMQILGNYGVSLPHYSGSQAQMGKKISSDEMRPGDLIFYSNSKGTINHVAMYIGNGQIVHAASRRSGIKISQWNYRRPTVIRNMLGD